MWLMSLSQHMSNYPKIFKVYLAVRNLNRGTYIRTEFNQARNLTEFLYDFNYKYFSFLCGGKKLQLNGHVTDKLLRHFGNEKGTKMKNQNAPRSSFWDCSWGRAAQLLTIFFQSQKSLQKLTRPRFLSKVKKEEGEDFLFRLTFLHPWEFLRRDTAG